MWTINVVKASLRALLLEDERVHDDQESFRLCGECMDPFVPLGSTVTVHRIEKGEVGPGDLLVHLDQHGALVAHRVVSLERRGSQPVYITKGDTQRVTERVPHRAAVYVVDRVAYLGKSYDTQSPVGRGIALFARIQPGLGIWPRVAKRCVRPLWGRRG